MTPMGILAIFDKYLATRQTQRQPYGVFQFYIELEIGNRARPLQRPKKVAIGVKGLKKCSFIILFDPTSRGKLRSLAW